MESKLQRSGWILILGIFFIAGCESSTGVTTDNGNSTPPNNVYFTLEGSDADADVRILKNGTAQFFGIVSPPWESETITARRNDSFRQRVCNATGDGFQLFMFLNGEQISAFFHQSSDPDNECTEKTVTLDETYNELLYD